MVGGIEKLVPKQIVHVIFLDPIDMGCIWRDGMHSEVVTGLIVIDDIRGVVDIAYAGSGRSAQVGSNARGTGSRAQGINGI